MKFATFFEKKENRILASVHLNTLLPNLFGSPSPLSRSYLGIGFGKIKGNLTVEQKFFKINHVMSKRFRFIFCDVVKLPFPSSRPYNSYIIFLIPHNAD